MARLRAVDPEGLPPDERAVYERIRATRGRPYLTGPFPFLMHSADIAERVAQVGAYVRFEGTLPPAVRALLALMVARTFDCRFEWGAHVRHARAAGVPDEVIDALRDRVEPTGLTAELRRAHDFAAQLLGDSHHVSHQAYEAALSHFGVDGVIDLTITLGYMTMIAYPLNAFEVDPRDGFEPLPP